MTEHTVEMQIQPVGMGPIAMQGQALHLRTDGRHPPRSSKEEAITAVVLARTARTEDSGGTGAEHHVLRLPKPLINCY
jgi:CxxC motif-containing protein (DUF1111 family)